MADIPKKFCIGGMPQLSSHLNTVLSRKKARRVDKIKGKIGEGPKTRLRPESKPVQSRDEDREEKPSLEIPQMPCWATFLAILIWI